MHYNYQKEYITWGYLIKKYNNDDHLVLNVMINFDSEHYDDMVYPYKVPYFSLSLEDMSNMDDKSYTPREYQMCRISMLEPKILGAEGENFKPDKEQIKILYDWLISPYKFEHNDTIYSSESGWKEIINQMIHEREGYKYLLDLPIPNYLEMEL